VRILVVCVGTLRGSPFADDAAHYQRLLRRQARIELEEVKEAPGGVDRKQELLEREAAAVLKRIPDQAYACVLDRQGEALSSIDLATFLEERRHAGADLCFVIGGAFGLADTVKQRADKLLSLGVITLPHQLARVVLLEQLFRAHKILSREPYHY
jgi:23S rRNA (pseudouridine1915-N3)-methyltransferase